MPGCWGRSPRQNKLKISPFPVGEGGRGAILPLRGRGAEKQAKGGVGEQPKRQAPHGVFVLQVQPVPLPAQARECKGRSPLHEITLIPPSPSGKGGRGLSFPFGEGGQKSKLKAGAAGNKESKPPRQIPGWLGEPTAPQRTVSATRSINRLRQSRARRSAMCTMASPVAEPCPFMTGLRTPSRRAPPCVL